MSVAIVEQGQKIVNSLQTFGKSLMQIFDVIAKAPGNLYVAGALGAAGLTSCMTPVSQNHNEVQSSSGCVVFDANYHPARQDALKRACYAELILANGNVIGSVEWSGPKQLTRTRLGGDTNTYSANQLIVIEFPGDPQLANQSLNGVMSNANSAQFPVLEPGTYQFDSSTGDINPK